MLTRCTNPNNTHFHNYGGRGITVCDRWKTFENFYTDMGDKPEGMSIDRIDNDKGYSLENCRWATRTEQTRNRKLTRIIEFNGQKRCVAEWAELMGISYKILRNRLDKKWSIEKALTFAVAARYL
jgi:hypothetical protein